MYNFIVLYFYLCYLIYLSHVYTPQSGSTQAKLSVCDDKRQLELFSHA